MQFTGRFWFVTVLLAAFLAVAGCSDEDGGVTDPLPDVTPDGDLQVHPDSLGTMAPLVDAVAQAQPGYVIVVFPGVYDGTLVVDKPLHFISSAGKENTILTNSGGGSALDVQIGGSYAATDSLILEGLGFNNAGVGVRVSNSTVPVTMRKCDAMDNAGAGLELAGAGATKAPEDGRLVLWQCFFRRNGFDPPEGSPPAASAALWCTGTLVAESIFFESNVIDIAMTDGARGTVTRMTSAESEEASLWLEGASDLTLDGVAEEVPTVLRSGSGWAAVVDGSRLSLIDFTVSRFLMGGFRVESGKLVLDHVILDANARYGIFSTESVDSLMSSQISSTGPSTDGEFGYGIVAVASESPRLVHLDQSLVQGGFRGGVQAVGTVRVELQGSSLKENGIGWGDDPIEDDPDAPIGGGIALIDGASANIDGTSTISLNFGKIGGGIAVVGETSNATIAGGMVEKNAALELGGGIVVSAGSVVFTGGKLASNACMGSGGGLAVIDEGSFDASGCAINGNAVFERGGGVYILEGHGGFTDGTQFIGNVARDEDAKTGSGGGIYLSEADLTLQGVLFETNMSEEGGALYAINLRQDVQVTECIFRQNISGNAAVYTRDLTRSLLLERCLLVENKLNDVTRQDATTIFSRQDLPGGELALLACTVANNQGGSGAIHHDSGNMSIFQSVVAFNVPAGLIGTDLAFVAMDCDDFWQNGEFDYGPGADPGPNSFSADPLFCDMDNGEFTVDAASPLLPGNNACAVQIGALGVGCGEGF